MPKLTVRSCYPVSRPALFAWHERPGAFERLSPPWMSVRLLERSGGIRDGGRLVIELRRWLARATWDARHHGYEEGRRFCDTQASGPMRRWTHEHRFEDDAAGSAVIDAVDFEPPLGALGRLVGCRLVRRDLERLFAFRQARLLADLQRLAEWDALRGSTEPLRVAVSGAGGALGGPLAAVLGTGGHRVVRLVRHRSAAADDVFFSPGGGPRGGQMDGEGLEGVDAVVHLAGEPVSTGRWNQQKMDQVRDSRVEGTRLLATTLAQLQKRPGVLVVASGTGLYGDRGDQELAEDAGVGSGYFAELARDWEAAAEPARQAGIRVVHLRLGAVLGARSGLLGVLRPLFALGLGAIPGDGSQWWSWIGLDDAVSVMLRAITDARLSGPVNTVSSVPVRAGEFCATLARVLDRPLFASAPPWLLHRVAGGRGDWALASARVVPSALRAAEFRCAHASLEEALRWELGIVGPATGLVWG